MAPSGECLQGKRPIWSDVGNTLAPSVSGSLLGWTWLLLSCMTVVSLCYSCPVWHIVLCKVERFVLTVLNEGYYYYYYYFLGPKAAGGNIEAKQCKWLQQHFTVIIIIIIILLLCWCSCFYSRLEHSCYSSSESRCWSTRQVLAAEHICHNTANVSECSTIIL